jgi:hypothetical protein
MILTDEEIIDICPRMAVSTARAIEAAVIEKIKAGGPVAWVTTSEECDLSMLFFNRDEACEYTDEDEPIPLYRI